VLYKNLLETKIKNIIKINLKKNNKLVNLINKLVKLIK